MTAPLPDIEHRSGEVTFRGEALKMLNVAIDAGIREKRGAGWSICLLVVRSLSDGSPRCRK